MNQIVARIPGDRSLRKPQHERYARARSCCRPSLAAAREAGYATMTAGNAAKLDRKPHIAARIAFLGRQAEDVLAAKRRHLEEFLWNIHDTNYADVWETVTVEVEDEDGHPALKADGTPRTKRIQRLRFMSDMPEDLQRAVEAVKYTDSGRPQLTMYSKMQASLELRKMLGIGRTGDEREEGEFDRMSDRELISELARQANELGVNVTLTYDMPGQAVAGVAAAPHERTALAHEP